MNYHLKRNRKLTSEEASELGRKSAESRRRRGKDAREACALLKRVLFASTPMTDKMKDAFRNVGIEPKQKESFFVVSTVALITNAVQRGNISGFVEIAKMAGLHFDQSPEGTESKPDNTLRIVVEDATGRDA